MKTIEDLEKECTWKFMLRIYKQFLHWDVCEFREVLETMSETVADGFDNFARFGYMQGEYGVDLAEIGEKLETDYLRYFIYEMERLDGDDMFEISNRIEMLEVTKTCDSRDDARKEKQVYYTYIGRRAVFAMCKYLLEFFEWEA
jgi:hypothetical protein